MTRRRLFIASNRLPVVVSPLPDGGWDVAPGAGGLITALAPVLRDRGGVWVGWAGTDGEPDGLREALQNSGRTSGFALEPVPVSAAERRDYYDGCSNEVLWPLFHDLLWHAHVEPAYWDAYVAVNDRFAATVVRESRGEGFLWIHDYHLMLVGRRARELGISGRIGFFLHVPFPPLDVYLKLPWRSEVLEALLSHDLLGFQTLRDRRNFLDCLHALVPGVVVRGKGQVVTAAWHGREVRIGAFPIGIDGQEFADGAQRPAVAARAGALRAQLGPVRVILGLDRLDYTKGIPQRLHAFRELLARHPEFRGQVTLLQFTVPSREAGSNYQGLKAEIENLVSRINGEFGQPGWVPVQYFYRALDREELLAVYRVSDVALVTPLKDGMNLVAKEYCAANVGGDGVLVLSEFAGAAAQLHGAALVVNPYDLAGTAATLRRALTLPLAERRERMRRLRRIVRERDVYWWVDSFLRAAFSVDLADFPREVVDWHYGGRPGEPAA